ncbi:MAG: hypothetical protein KF774_01125 [Planctomyces sp.]|nr:hypothetical protein [Planctomyces sp.]
MSNSASRQIPEFREDGYLPVGVFRASAEKVIFRFGSPNRKRRQLVLRIRRWIELAKAVGAIKLLVDGSFVTSAESPNDVDAVVWLPLDFAEQLARTFEPAMELESMLLSRSPEEQGAGGGGAMISTLTEYERARDELRDLESRLGRLEQEYPIGKKGYTKAGVRKLIARLHEELAVYEGAEASRSTETQ